MKKVQVRFSKPRNPGYEILIEPGILKRANSLLAQKFKGYSPFLISSPRVFRLYGRRLKAEGRHLVPDGEQNKSFKEYARALAALAAFGRGQKKKPLAVLLGGGVIGDLGGFVAASYKRGIPFVQVPTTLLSMVDSSVGGKLGIDFDTPQGGIKNLVGAFAQPSLVLIDPKLVTTLHPRDYRSGLAEAVKTAALFDRRLFDRMEEGAWRLLAQDEAMLTHVIAACVGHKARIVMKDEFDRTGVRALLNLGHTFGHAVEAASHFKLLHGEAVAFGMACAVELSARLRLADPELMRLTGLLARLGLPVRLPRLPMARVLAALSEDKKFAKGMQFVLPRRIGKSRLGPVKSLALVRAVLASRFD